MNHTEKITSQSVAKISRAIIYAVLIAQGVVSIFPFFWMLSTSLKRTLTLQQYPPQLIPRNPTLANYIEMFSKTEFFTWLTNSVVVTSLTVVLTILFSLMAAYPFAKKRFFGQRVLFLLILATLMVPWAVRVVPLYLLTSRMKLLNSYFALVLPAIASPFGIYLLKEYLATIPNDLMDSARVDGCSDMRILFNILAPICKPALAALAILSTLESWNSFMWPLIVTTEGSRYTLPVGLALFQGQFITEWGMVMAGSTLAFLPMLVIFLVLQRYFVQGIAMSGIKG